MCIYIREEEMITVKHVSGLLIWSLEVIVRFQLIVFKKKKKENVEKKKPLCWAQVQIQNLSPLIYKTLINS